MTQNIGKNASSVWRVMWQEICSIFLPRLLLTGASQRSPFKVDFSGETLILLLPIIPRCDTTGENISFTFTNLEQPWSLLGQWDPTNTHTTQQWIPFSRLHSSAVVCTSAAKSAFSPETHVAWHLLPTGNSVLSCYTYF